MTIQAQAANNTFTCRVRFDDAGVYGCNVWVLDPRDSRWHRIDKIVTTRESWNVEPYSERCAWDNKAEAIKAAKRRIRKIGEAMGVYG